MAQIPRSDATIGFLIDRRFPHASGERTPPKIEAYYVELLSMSEAEFRTLLDEEKRKLRVELEARAEREDLKRFFHRPDANADYVHWSKAAYWTLDEAAALSFGKEPKLVYWKSVEDYVGRSPFANKYERLRDLIGRSRHRLQLSDPVLPTLFIAWTKQNEMDFPPDLEAAVTARGQLIANWKNREDIQKRLDEEKKAHETCKTALLHAREQMDQLSQLNTKLQTELGCRKTKKDNLHPKERETLLKLIIAMAIKGYAYKPGAARNDATAEIANDVSDVGLSIDQDTVRKWLTEAVDVLPPGDDK